MTGRAGPARIAALAVALLAPLSAYSLEITRLEVPDYGPPLDAGLDGSGAVVFLYRGFPRVVRLEEGAAVELDLSETALPGGLCVLESGQMLVSDLTSGVVRRYSPEGAVLQVMEAPGSPGDLAMIGLEVWYYSRDESLARSAGRAGRVVFRPPVDRPMTLSGASLEGVAVAGGAWRLGPGEPPALLAVECLDAAMVGGGPAVLLDSVTVLAPPADTLCLPLPVSRAAGSPSGRLLLWSPDSGTALLVR